MSRPIDPINQEPESPPAHSDYQRSMERKRIAQQVRAVPFKMRRKLKGDHAQRLFEDGWTNDDIAWVLGVSDGREVRRLRSEADALETSGPDPRDLDDLPLQYRAMVEPWLVLHSHLTECRACWDDHFTGHDALVDAAVEGYVAFFDHFNREGLTFAEHARTWVWESFRHIRLLLNVPPRHAKSTYLSIWLPIFLVSADRDFQVLITSQTNDFAKKFCRAVAYEMDNNDDLIEAFGRFRPTDSKLTWSPSQGQLKVEGSTSGDRSIQIRGAGQQVLGMEANWITVDDPDDPEVARSETEERKLREWYEEQVISRGAPGCHVTVIGQRVGFQDIYGWLAKKRNPLEAGRPPIYRHLVTPAILDWEAHEVLWPDVWPFDRLIKERYIDNPDVFEVMYQQNPKAAGETIFLPAWIQGDEDHPGCLDRERRLGEGMPRGQGFPISRVISVDPSPTMFTGIIVADIMHNYQEFHASLVHIETEKVHGRDILMRIDDLMRMFGPIDYILIEDSAVSKWIWQDPWFYATKDKTSIRSHNTTSKSKGDPEWGVQSLAIDFEFGRIRFPFGDTEGREASELLLQEMYSYTPEEKNRFDLIMALWFIRYAHRALVPNVMLQGGFANARVGQRVSPGYRRAAARHGKEDVIKRYRAERELKKRGTLNANGS